MVKLKKKIKERIFSKGTIVYIIGLFMTFLPIFAVLVISNFDLSFQRGEYAILGPVDLLLLFDLFILIPLSTIAYGIISYSSTKMVIIPNILLFAGCSLCSYILKYNTSHAPINLESLIAVFGNSGILTAVSLATSIITAIITLIIKLIVKVIKKIIRSKPQQTK